MEVNGKIKVVNETQVIGDKFKKREVVVTTDDKYPQDISIEFVQDKCDMLDSYKKGDDVKVFINLRGRGWTNPEGVEKHFNTIQGWRIENTEQAAAPKEVVAKDDMPF